MRQMTIRPSEDVRAGRMLAAGRLTATVRSLKTGRHITVRAKAMRRTADGWTHVPLDEATHVFVDVPRPNDRGDRLGTYYPPRDGRPGRWYSADRVDPAREWAALQVLAHATGAPAPTAAEIMVADFCGRCGRELTDPVSIERGIGPECYGKMTGSHHQTKVKAEAGTVEIEAQSVETDGTVTDQAVEPECGPHLDDRPGEDVFGAPTAAAVTATLADRCEELSDAGPGRISRLVEAILAAAPAETR